jgi:general stress protein 26
VRAVRERGARCAPHIALALLCVAPLARVPAQVQRVAAAGVTSQDLVRRERVIRVARDIIEAARFAALITHEPATGSFARAIDPAPPDSAMVIRFVTNPKSRKVRQLARDARVTLYFFDAKAMRYATVYGTAREVRDAARKSSLWYAGWTPFYPQRERGAALYEVVPRRLEVVSEADSVVGDPVTWEVPMVRFPSTPARR